MQMLRWLLCSLFPQSSYSSYSRSWHQQRLGRQLKPLIALTNRVGPISRISTTTLLKVTTMLTEEVGLEERAEGEVLVAVDEAGEDEVKKAAIDIIKRDHAISFKLEGEH